MKRLVVSLVAVALVAGCGVRPTEVLDGGAPASGIPEGMRIYFASDRGLRGVSRPDKEITELAAAVKLVMAGPNEAELVAGLTDLTAITGEFSASAIEGHVTLRLPRTPVTGVAGMAAGQLVCTLARAESLLHGTRPDAVRVTVVAQGGAVGPYQCSQFLTG
ncbi:GerMN domain-containing protein [Amycolatopsis roodepoortensis]|uniref:GerMN domain-containing protein n=1 Tax=Amycolatopsis roodepoortensis TaxID=700274 RepID=A0ABR9LF20_9PSEU|nr:GerMN domain-containing protein [Amycolatopsis roodepoortensis]MBE1579107.1 hypothetical protein [Amycolatopsis roodepoortensis]RSN26660.1 hypothetical protein DMC63_02170 [Streptomyces sp. WAC 05977]UUV34421.1 GerMN domain-containing protein [Amycolatopsis roodepoortensis]